MKKFDHSKHFIKWLIIIAISIAVSVLGCFTDKAKAEPEESGAPSGLDEAVSPTLIPAGWYPDWVYSEFPETTPSPAPSEAPEDFRVIEEDLSDGWEMPSSFNTYYNPYRAYVPDIYDTSVWYLQNPANVQVTRAWPFSYWVPSGTLNPYVAEYVNGIPFRSSGVVYPLSDDRTFVNLDEGCFVFSFTEQMTDELLNNTCDLCFCLSLQNAMPHLYDSSPAMDELYLSDVDLLSMPVDIYIYYSYTEPEGSFDYQSSYWNESMHTTYSEMLSWHSYSFSLSDLPDGAYLTEVRFLCVCGMPGQSWPMRDQLTVYFNEHPEITNRIYGSWSYASGAMPAYARFVRQNKTSQDQGWFVSLFYPNENDIAAIFQEYGGIDSGAVSDFCLGLRSWLYDLILGQNASARDFSITTPQLSIPVNGTDYVFAQSYTYNFSQVWNSDDYATARYAVRFITSCVLVAAFLNGIFSFFVGFYDLHAWDGVGGREL